jgi:hypothetical protein
LSTVRGLESVPSRMTVAATATFGAGAVALVALLDPHSPGHYPACPLHALTGLYCPFCGGLRAVHDLAHLDIVGALARNPLVVVALPFALALWLGWAQQAFTGRRFSFRSQRASTALLVGLLVFAVFRNLPGASWLSPA